MKFQVEYVKGVLNVCWKGTKLCDPPFFDGVWVVEEIVKEMEQKVPEWENIAHTIEYLKASNAQGNHRYEMNPLEDKLMVINMQCLENKKHVIE